MKNPITLRVLRKRRSAAMERALLLYFSMLLAIGYFRYCDKHQGQKQLGEERVYCTYRLWSIEKREQGRKLKVKPWIHTAHRLPPLGSLSILLSYSTQEDHLPEVDT